MPRRRLVGLVALFVLTQTPSSFAANADTLDALSLDERLERSSSFNAYVEDILRAEKRQTAKRWFLSGSAVYGYDDNPTINSRRAGDAYHEETAGLTLLTPHTGFLGGLLGPGEAGIQGDVIWRTYDTERGVDHYNALARPYVKAGFAGGTLDVSYAADWLGYVHNQSLDYIRHEGTSGIRWTIVEGLSHRPYFSYSVKEYMNRRASTGDGRASDAYRRDRAIEAGHEITVDVKEGTQAGVRYSWERNDSNDTFQDFYDFDRYAVNGFIRQRFTKRLLGIFRAGYDCKDYDSRPAGSTAETETDDYFYLSGNLFFTLTPNTQIGLNYLYSQNDSNSPAQDYSFSNVTVGLYFDF